MISSADFIRPLPFRRWVCWHQPSPVGKGAIARQRHAPATTCRADLMATGGQISCPPAGNFLSVSGQFPLSADTPCTAGGYIGGPPWHWTNSRPGSTRSCAGGSTITAGSTCLLYTSDAADEE